MKKVLFLFLALGVGKLFSQSNVPPTPFDFTSGQQSFTVSSTQWILDDGVTNSPNPPACNVGGSSGGNLFFGKNSIAAGSTVNLVSPAINTTTFVSLNIRWNSLQATGASPAVKAEWSKDNGSTWTTITYTNLAVGGNTWAAVSSVTLPAAAAGTVIVLRWSYVTTGTGSGNDYVGIDDILLSGTPTPAYYYFTGGLHNTTSWWTVPGGTGTNPSDFTSNNQNFFLLNGTATLTADWAVSGISTFLNVGDGTSGNKFNLVIPANFSLAIGNGSGTDSKLVVSNSSSLTVINTTVPAQGDVTIGLSSTVDFAQTSSVTLWGGSFTYGNLTLSGGGDKYQNGNLQVSGNFIIRSGTNYIMEATTTQQTILSGSISCLGNITQGLSRLTIQGSSTIGTLNFNGSGGIQNLTLNRPSSTLTLGSNLLVNNITTLTNGNIAINGKSFTMNGAITFQNNTSNGVITGSAAGSSLTIGGSGSITNAFLIDQTSANTRSLSAFTMNRASTTLILGNQLTTSTTSIANGNISMNDKIWTINGPITFPTSVSNGKIIGSDACALTIGGAGAYTNSLFMDQTSLSTKTFGSFTNNRSLQTLVMGNNLAIGASGVGTANFANGILDLNGNLLTLSGPITWPGSATNRGIKGSLTSSISIDGSGSIGGFMFMVQTSTLIANRFLSSLSLDRTGEILTLGNPLETYGEILPTAGTLDTDAGVSLYIRSDATRKGRIGPVTGVVAGSVNVETYAAGGNTDWTNLGVSGITGQTLANWDTQIPMTCVGCMYSPLATGGVYFASVQGWTETAAASSSLAYIEQVSTSPLNPGQGYWTYLGTATGTTAALSWTVVGTAVQGDQDLPLTNSGALFGDGYNFIANPFPSPISWHSILASNTGTATGVDNAIYVYNPDVGGTTAYSGFVSDFPYPLGITDTIPMGQGFYVQAVNPYTLTIHESDKVSRNFPLLRTANNNNVGSVVRLRVDGSDRFDYTAIRFHGDATPGFDKDLDAHKLFSAPSGGVRTSISTKSGSEDYSINSLPNATTEDAVIPVLVKVKATGQHTISGTDLQNLPNSCVILKDKLTNITHDLKASPYVCNINTSETTPRFELRICADITMSVDEKAAAAQNVFVSQDANGVFVKLNYDKATKSTISVTNILGQKIIDNKSVTVDKDVVYLNIPEKNQLLFVTVTTEDNKVTKKIVR